MGIEDIEKRKTIHSGGASGADTLFSIMALKYGLDVITHSFEGHTPTKESLKSGIVIKHNNDLEEGRNLLKLAQTHLGRNPPKSKFIENLLLRNYHQVKNSKLIVGISKIKDFDNCLVDGGTGYAVAMAYILKIPILIFDQGKWNWYYSVNNSKFEELKRLPNINKFPEQFAGIGSRKLKEGIEYELEKVFYPLIYKSFL